MFVCGSGGNGGLSASAESVHYKRPSRRSKHLNRSSSRRNKENGARKGSFRNNKNATNVSANEQATNQQQQLAKRNARVSFEPPTSSGGSIPAGTNKPAYSYEHHHSKSIDQVVGTERRNSQHEFNNRLSVDNDLLVSTVWSTSATGDDHQKLGSTGALSSTGAGTVTTTTTSAATTTTHSKPPRI